MCATVSPAHCARVLERRRRPRQCRASTSRTWDNVQFAISGNGRYASSPRRDQPRPPRGTDQGLYRKDLQTGAVTLVSVNSAGSRRTRPSSGTPTSPTTAAGWCSPRSGDDQPVPGRRQRVSSDIVVRDIAAGTRPSSPSDAAGARPTGRPSARRSAPTATSSPSRRRPAPSTFSRRRRLGFQRHRRSEPGRRDHRGRHRPYRGTDRGSPTSRGWTLRRLRDRPRVRPDQRRRGEGRLPPRHDDARHRPRLGRERQRDGLGRRRVRPAISADGARVSFTSLSAPTSPGPTPTPLATTSMSATRASLLHPPGECAGGRHHRQQHRLSSAAQIAGNGGLVRVRPQRRGRGHPSWSPPTPTTSPTSSRRNSRRATRPHPRWRSRARREGLGPVRDRRGDDRRRGGRGRGRRDVRGPPPP